MNHISIEGMDGVGKSTTCKLLAEKLEYIFVEKPLHYLLDDSDDEIKQIISYVTHYHNCFAKQRIRFASLNPFFKWNCLLA